MISARYLDSTLVADKRPEAAPSADPAAAALRVQRCSLDEVCSDWANFSGPASSGGLFTAPLWVVNYWRHRSRAGGEPLLLAAQRGGRVVGILPLVRDGNALCPILRAAHAAGEYESDWPCVASAAPAFASAMLDELSARNRGWFALRATLVREDSPVLSALLTEAGRSGLAYDLRAQDPAPFVPTDGTGGDALALTTRKYRGELRRRRRHLEEMGTLRFEDTRETEGLHAKFERFVDVEGAGWKSQRGSSIGCEPDARNFWWGLAQDAAAAGALRLHLLYLDDQVISGQFGVVWGDRYYCLKVGYDERYQRLGTGALLTAHALQSCLDDPGVRVYDFAGPAQPYMWNWTELAQPRWDLWIGSREFIRGTLFNGLTHARRLWRRLRRRQASVLDERSFRTGPGMTRSREGAGG